MALLVEKKDGAIMECKQCGTDLICRLKDYGGTYAPSLQWQNHDGSAHYKTSDGKNWNCNVPQDDGGAQQTIHSGSPTTPGTIPPPPTPNPQQVEILNILHELHPMITRIFEMTEAVMHYTVDQQLRKNEPDS